MPPLSLDQLYERYTQLDAQIRRGEISHEQFVEQARQLQAQDSAGNWWTIDPATGHYLTYTANGWVDGTPGAAQPGVQQATSVQQAQPISQRPRTAQPQPQGGLRGCLSSPIVTLLLSVGTAVLWFAYTSLSPSSESLDLKTPLVIAGTPILLQLLRRPIDKLLNPLYRMLNALPRPLLVGAALAVPIVMGGIFTRSSGDGYGGLQRTALVSVILCYVLTRRPGVAR